jgi:hypothetical protein
MPLVFSGYQTANTQRNYPLHDQATKAAIGGDKMPDDVLADAHLMIPESAGKFVFVSSVGITPGLVSLTFLATDVNPLAAAASSSSSSPSTSPVPSGFVPLAVVTVPKPVEQFRMYPVEAQFPGVGGWVAFGPRVIEGGDLNLRFDDPAASFLATRAARFYKAFPAASLGLENILTELTGLVRLSGEAGLVSVRKGRRRIFGSDRDVVIVGLDLAQNAREILEQFTGPCGARPNVFTCEKDPFIEVNGAVPDANGNIEIEFQDDIVTVDADKGIVLDFPIGLQDVCLTFDDVLFSEDICNLISPSPSPSFSPGPSISPSPEPSVSPSPSPSPPTPPVDGVCEDFEGVGAPLDLTEIEGNFKVVSTSRTKRYRSQPGFITHRSLDLSRTLTGVIPADTNAMSATIRLLSPDSAGHIIFGHKGNTEFLFAGVSLRVDPTVPGSPPPPGKFYVGHRVLIGQARWPNGLGLGYFFDSDVTPIGGMFETDVELTLTTIGKVVTAKFDWISQDLGPLTQSLIVDFAGVPGVSNLSGFAGVGASFETEFDDLLINCVP